MRYACPTHGLVAVDGSPIPEELDENGFPLPFDRYSSAEPILRNYCPACSLGGGEGTSLPAVRRDPELERALRRAGLGSEPR